MIRSPENPSMTLARIRFSRTTRSDRKVGNCRTVQVAQVFCQISCCAYERWYKTQDDPAEIVRSVFFVHLQSVISFVSKNHALAHRRDHSAFESPVQTRIITIGLVSG